MKANCFYKLSPRNKSKVLVSDESEEEAGKFFRTGLDMERHGFRGKVFGKSFLASIELEIRKVLPDIVINFEEDLKKSICTLVCSILSGEFPCKNCQGRIETIKQLTNDLQAQNISTLDEIEKLKEMKQQVMKYENLLKTKEKNLELQTITLAENTELLIKKDQMIEKNMKKLESEKNKILEERKKLDEEKKFFNKKFKKLDEQFFCINREMTQRDSKDTYETNNKEKLDLAAKSQELNQISSEIQLKHQTVLEFIQKFTDMKTKFEQNQKDFEKIIKEKVSKDEEKESKSHQKIKKITKKLKEMELKVKDLVIKNLDLSLIKTEEVTEKFIIKPEPEYEEKDSIVQKNNSNLPNLEKNNKDLQEKYKNLETKEKELQAMQEQINLEKNDIAKTAKYLQDIFIQLELQRKSLGLEKQIVQNEKEASQNYLKHSIKHEKKPFKSLSSFPDLPDLTNRQSLHFADEDIIIKINDKKT